MLKAAIDAISTLGITNISIQILKLEFALTIPASNE